MNWNGKIIAEKRNMQLVNFRLEPELIKELNKIKNKSELIREAVKEKLNRTIK